MNCKYCGYAINKTKENSIWSGDFEWSHAPTRHFKIGAVFCRNVNDDFRFGWDLFATPDEAWKVEQLLKEYDAESLL
jgi:hypothetical protein